jgi:hypothetical protein
MKTPGHRTSIGIIDDETLKKMMLLTDRVNGKPVVPGSTASPAVKNQIVPQPMKLIAPAFHNLFNGVRFTLAIKLAPTTNHGMMKKWLMGVAAKHRRVWFEAFAPRIRDCLFLFDHVASGKILHVTITRLGRQMDTDNLPPTAKWLRDSVALSFGKGDGANDPFLWYYKQSHRMIAGAIVEISLNPPEAK